MEKEPLPIISLEGKDKNGFFYVLDISFFKDIKEIKANISSFVSGNISKIANSDSNGRVVFLLNPIKVEFNNYFTSEFNHALKKLQHNWLLNMKAKMYGLNLSYEWASKDDYEIKITIGKKGGLKAYFVPKEENT